MGAEKEYNTTTTTNQEVKMEVRDKRLSRARTELTCWNMDRRRGYRGSKGYAISRNTYHRVERRFARELCRVEAQDSWDWAE